LDQLKSHGFAGIQNFPAVGIIEGVFRANLEETGMGYGLEAEDRHGIRPRGGSIRLAASKDLQTTPFVFNADEARTMARVGADIIVCNMGLTVGGAIGAQTVLSLDECVERVNNWAEVAAKIRKGDRSLSRRTISYSCRCRIHSRALSHVSWIPRSVFDGTSANGTRVDRSNKNA
jgi:predicted TIM-barrel enzyme